MIALRKVTALRILFLTLTYLRCTSGQKLVMNQESRQVQIPGGFNLVSCNDIGVRNAVKYAVNLFFSSSPPPMPTSKKGKKGKNHKGKRSTDGNSGISFKVYKAEKQVQNETLIHLILRLFSFLNFILNPIWTDSSWYQL
jgi:hypothetical protein